MKKKLAVLGEYVGHLAIGALMFLALLLFGGTLTFIVDKAGPFIGDDSFSTLIKGVERFILYADIAFIVWWAVYSTYQAIKELHHE